MNAREEMSELTIDNFVNSRKLSTDHFLTGKYLIHIDNCQQCDFDADYLFAAEMSDAILHSHI